ncbi:hypothetical protein B0H17DRAFT_1214618 [Mycena rosella]|uniref:GEgh 16 protein n=1 Tax=Mycena rosella TaxID=1033263 RepID=A0AAD7CMK6_MYCRO|nr:hypothetical protein B0H17DRAFT_1214618 [Mycena rosella]
MFFNTFLVFAAVSSHTFLNAHAHGTITGVTGANGVQAAGFGIIATTPRDGSTPKPFEQDTSVIRDNAIASGKTGVCGSTKAGGNNDVASQLAGLFPYPSAVFPSLSKIMSLAASQAGLPTAAADGSVTMTLHQVNQDGAGPYTCDVSGDGGNTFQAATVTTQVPGKFGLSTAKATDFQLVAQMPAGMACTAGPNGDACIMRCKNPALAGPFGSCVAVSNGSGGNATAAAGTAAAPAAEAAPAAAAGGAAAAAPATDAAAGAAGAAPAAGAAATGAKAGLAGLLSKIKGGRDVNAPAKRHIVSRVAGKRSGHWLDNQ